MFIKLFEKIISLVLFDTNRSFKWLNTLSLTKELFIEVSTVHRVANAPVCNDNPRQISQYIFESRF